VPKPASAALSTRGSAGLEVSTRTGYPGTSILYPSSPPNPNQGMSLRSVTSLGDLGICTGGGDNDKKVNMNDGCEPTSQKAFTASGN